MMASVGPGGGLPTIDRIKRAMSEFYTMKALHRSTENSSACAAQVRIRDLEQKARKLQGASANTVQKKSGEKKKKGKGKGKTPKDATKCENCGRVGHNREGCWELRPKLAPGWYQQKSGASTNSAAVASTACAGSSASSSSAGVAWC